MLKAILIGLLAGAAFLKGCDDPPRQQQVTLPDDYLREESCKQACKYMMDEAVAQSPVCMDQCRLAQDRQLSECDEWKDKDKAKWQACRLEALDAYAACQDTCIARLTRVNVAYDSCARACVLASVKER